MPKEKTTAVNVAVESKIWTRTKGYSEYTGMDKGDIVSASLKLYFKTLDEIESNIKKGLDE